MESIAQLGRKLRQNGEVEERELAARSLVELAKSDQAALRVLLENLPA